MGRKKKKPVKPWCWYCNREFDDEKILIQHQRAKHFKCPFCHKKLYSGPGLTVHCVQVHKEQLDKIPEALPNKNSVDIDIYGMQGVPEDDIREHERLKRGDTDNGGGGSGGSKAQEPTGNSKSQPKAPNLAMQQSNSAMSSMHAAMFQRATMGLGGMPPGFPPMMAPPPMMMPPMAGMPPGFIPPPGLPPSMGSMMPPGMPMPPGMAPLGFPPGMMPPTSMGFSMRPPNMALIPPPRGMIPPPPMSGVGHLIGVPPPNFSTLAPPPPPPPPPLSEEANQSQRDSVDRYHQQGDSQDNNSQLDRNRMRGNKIGAASSDEIGPGANEATVASSTTICKPASASQVTSSSPTLESKSFIDIPNSKSRIMHPNSELSLEELRLGLSKYRDLMEKLPPPPQVPSMSPH